MGGEERPQPQASSAATAGQCTRRIFASIALIDTTGAMDTSLEVSTDGVVMGALNTRVVQVTNIAPQATRDQMHALFSMLGEPIEELRLYPTVRDMSVNITSRVAFIQFAESAAVAVCQHLNNTVFIDRAIIVSPVMNGEMPDETLGLQLARAAQGGGAAGGSPAQKIDGLAKMPPHVINRIEGVAPNAIIQTHDPTLEAAGLPPYPPLPASTGSDRVEEIRRTVCVIGLDSTVSAQQCMEAFAAEAGEVKYFRYCTSSTDSIKYALIEFTEQSSVAKALTMNDRQLGLSRIKVTHALQAIVKPQNKSNEAAQREIEEAMSKVKETQNLVSAAVDPLMGMLGAAAANAVSAAAAVAGTFAVASGVTPGLLSGSGSARASATPRSRSRSISKRPSSRERSRYSSRRSRSRDRRRSRSRDRRRSRSRDRRRSRSRDRRRSRSRDRKRSRRSRSRDRRRRSRSRDKGRRKDKKDDRKEKYKEDKSSKEDEKETKTKDENGSSQSAPDEAPAPKLSENGENKDGNEVDDDEGKEVESAKSKSSKRHRSRSRSKDRSSRRRRSRSRSRDRKKARSRSRDRDRKRRSRSPRKRSKSPRERRSRRRSREAKELKPNKVSRDYDEEEEGFEALDDDEKSEGAPPPSPKPTISEENMEAQDMEISDSP